MTTARITFRLFRFEIVAVALMAVAVAAAALVIAWRLGNLHVPLDCFGQPDVHGPTGSNTAACRAGFNAFQTINDREAERLFAVLAGFPVVAGVLLGVAAVSREIENGSAALSWTMSGRRLRWLARRTIVLGGLILAFLIPDALSADLLESVRNPLTSAGASFASEGLRGAVLVARGLAGFGVGLAIGAILGRQLPSAIVGLLAAVAIVTIGLSVMYAWGNSAAVYLPTDAARLGDRSIRAAYRGRDGQIVSVAAIADLQPPNPSFPPGTIDDRWITANFDEVLLVVPGARYGEEVALHSALLLLVGGAGAAVAALVLNRRRIS